MFLRKEPLKHAKLPEVTPGAEVWTADDASIGTVAEVGEVSFKVDVPRGPDMWLGRDYVIESAADRVTMSFERSELNAYKLGQPGMAPEKDTSQESLTDTAVPPEQQIEQRVRMEEQLAEQRQRLPHTHPGGDEDVPPETRGGTIGEPVESELREYGIDPMAERETDEGRDAGAKQFSEAGSYVPQASTAADAPAAGRPTVPGTGTTGFEYSVPTRTDDYDPAKARRAITGGTMGAVAAVSLAGLGFLWLMQRRRRHRKLDARAKDAAIELADVAKVAVKRGVDRARGAMESAQD